MKAKEILRLCEDNQKLTSDEIFDLINDYFVKKMKLIGATIRYDGSAELDLSSDTEYEKQLKRYKLYVKRLSKLLGKAYPISSAFGSRIEVMITSLTLDIEYQLFNVGIYISNHNELYLCIDYATSFRHERLLNGLSDDEDFSSKEGRERVYKVIDLICKSIRLTPVD